MLIDFREIPAGGRDVTSKETVTWGDSDEAGALRDLYAFPEPFLVKSHLEKLGDNVFVSGTFTGEVKTRCVRCLKTFDQSLEETFRLTLLPRASFEAKAQEHELEADDIDLAYYDVEKVDLGAIVSEQVALLLDLYPRCRPDCKGLCPVCGNDRNDLQCACEANHEDSKFAALKKFKAP